MCLFFSTNETKSIAVLMISQRQKKINFVPFMIIMSIVELYVPIYFYSLIF